MSWRRLTIAACVLASLPACDWDYYALMNSIPVEGDPKANPVVHVVLGIDGLAWRAAVDAQARGAFPGWHLSRHVTGFPGTSDVSWSRILRTAPVEGYEYQYYDPLQQKLVGDGVVGLAMHAIPTQERPCYQAFDYVGNGLTNTYYQYRSTEYSLGESLDNIFTLVEGRAQAASTDVFLAFVLEVDAIGHMQGYEPFVEALMTIDKRIEAFKAAHPERTWVFTIVSDHGHNFIASPNNRMVRYQNELPKVGIEVLESLEGRDASSPLGAIPIIHGRVTYVSLHTVPAQAPEIARRVSTFEHTDLAIAKVGAPADSPVPTLPWYGVWRDGALAVSFGFDAATDLYYVDLSGDLEPLGLGWMTGDRFATFGDEELFSRCLDSSYPDLLYRTRTALEPIGVRWPPQVVVSFRQPFASVGFEIPGGANEVATASFHGAMHSADTVGVVLTEQPGLPEALRSDTFLDFFPDIRAHVQSRQATVERADANQGLDYALLSQ